MNEEIRVGDIVGEYTRTTLNRVRVLHQLDTTVARKKKI